MISADRVEPPFSDRPPAGAEPLQRETAMRLCRRAVRGGTIFLVTRLGIQGFQWIVTLFLARLLLPDDYGLMATAGVLLGLAETVAEAGLGRALIQKKAVTATEQAQAFTLGLLLSVGLYGALWGLAPLAAQHLERPQFALFLRVTALGLLCVPVQAVGAALLERELKFGAQSAIQTAAALVHSVLVLVLACRGYGAWALGLSALAVKLLQSAATGYASRWRPSLAWPSAAAGRLARYGALISLSSLCWYVYSNADFAVLSLLKGTAALGYYFMAYQLISIPTEKLSAHINQVAFATFCRLQDDRARMRGWFSRLIALLALVGAPALIGLALVADDAIPWLLGERWRPAVLPLQLLAPVGAVMVFSYTLSPYFNALGRPDLNLQYAAVCAVLFPPVFLAAGRAAGTVGVCLAWLLLYPGIVAVFIHRTRLLTGFGLRDFLRPLGPVLRGVLCMGAAVFLVRRALAGEGLIAWRLAAAIFTGAAVYAVAILAFGRRTVVADVGILLRELRGRRLEDPV
jgi:O-antigen/teichoic acid export membrane protein